MIRTKLAILKILDKQNDDTLVGSRELSRQLELYGVKLTERAVRYHLKIMDERGLTKVFGKEGRQITPKGREELANALVSQKVGFILSEIENLSYQTDFDTRGLCGRIILNVSMFPEKELGRALEIMMPVFSSPYVMSDMVVLARQGQSIGGVSVPEGRIGIGTMCSVTINGIFLKEGIPVASRFGGVLEVHEDGLSRFVSLISYGGSSLDPHLAFIKSRMTSVTGAVGRGSGNVLASFREIPLVCVEQALELQNRLGDTAMGGILIVGNPNQPLLGMSVGADRAGMVLVGGLNPIAALEEAGIRTDNSAMPVLYEYTDLSPFKEAAGSL